VFIVNFNDSTIKLIDSHVAYENMIDNGPSLWSKKAYYAGIRLAISDHDFTQE